MKCDERNCFQCAYEDCISENPPLVEIDEYLQLERDEYEVDINVKEVEVVPEDGIELLMSDELKAFCNAKCVAPRIKADVEILKRAQEGDFKGKKLEKAIYKVRHREKVQASKKRSRLRKKGMGKRRHD